MQKQRFGTRETIYLITVLRKSNILGYSANVFDDSCLQKEHLGTQEEVECGCNCGSREALGGRPRGE